MAGGWNGNDPRIPPGGSIGPNGEILDANGNPVLGADGKPLMAGGWNGNDPRIPPGGSIGPNGEILDANGNPVLGADGKPLMTDSLSRSGDAAGGKGGKTKGGKKGKKGKKGKATASDGSADRMAQRADGTTGNGNGNGDVGGKPEIEWKPEIVSDADAAEILAGTPGWDPFADSCWAPRALWSDAKSLVDTEEVERARFSNDWHRVAHELGTAKMVMRYDDDGIKDADGDGVSDEVQEIERCLWQHHSACLTVFDWYGAIGASGGSGDISFLSLNTWTQFVLDFGLVDKKSKFCKQSDFDTLFITIDGVAARAQQQHLKEEEEARRTGSSFALGRGPEMAPASAGAGTAASTPTPSRSKGPESAKLMHQQTAKFEDKRKMFSRCEFYAALVAISIKKYVEPKIIPDVSEAFEKFMETDILPRLKKTHASPTSFRLRHLYTQQVDEILKPRLPSLRIVFEGLVSRSKSAPGRRHKLLSLQDWCAFLKGANLSGRDATERDVTLCFVWSRMCVADERTEMGHLREEMIPFEGFLEVRSRLMHLCYYAAISTYYVARSARDVSLSLRFSAIPSLLASWHRAITARVLATCRRSNRSNARLVHPTPPCMSLLSMV